jgi:RecB family endonuclease NucS
MNVKTNLVLENPSLGEAFNAIKNGFSERKSILIVGECDVDYIGRASSRLESGERIIILKPDGSALVHRPRDYAPVNWQPPGALFRIRIKDNFLIVRVFRKKENEVLEVKFNHFFLVAIFNLKDTAEFYLHATEKDMQRAIMEKPSLIEEGFRPFSIERSVDPGFIDVIGRDSQNNLIIIEIKRNISGRDAVLQLQKYVNEFKKDSSSRVRGILVAPGLAKGAQKLLASLGLEFKALSPENCSFVLKKRDNKKITDFLK